MLEIDLNIVFHNLLLWFIISFMVFKKNFGGFEFYVNLHVVFSFLSAALKIMQSIFWQKTEPFHILCRLLPKHFHFYQSKIVKWNSWAKIFFLSTFLFTAIQFLQMWGQIALLWWVGKRLIIQPPFFSHLTFSRGVLCNMYISMHEEVKRQ